MNNQINIGEIWQHYKTGGKYEILNLAKLQVKVSDLDMAECVVYKSVEDSLVWVRPVADFLEIVDPENETSRFTKID